MGKAKYFTRIDLTAAFWQIPLKKQDRFKTAFACELGLFEWRRMPFGLCNATATFQRMMAKALKGIEQREGSLVMCYVDDVIIATDSIEEHMLRLREVFDCLQRAGLKCKSSKCSFLRSEAKFLGRIIDGEGMRPDPEAIAKVQDWKAPRNKSEMSSFLGFANYYREFIQDYATKSHPLASLIRKNKHTVGRRQHKKRLRE